jgi:hypothetical protein
MPQHFIPLGNVPDSEIAQGLNEATKHACTCLAQKLGNDFQINFLEVATQHQVAGDNKRIKLKYAEREVCIRRGLFEGATVRIVWSDARKDAARLSVSSGVRFQGWLIFALIVAALITSGYVVFNTNLIALGRFGWFFLFGLVMIPLLLPYLGFCIFSRLKNGHLVEEVSALISQEFKI